MSMLAELDTAGFYFSSPFQYTCTCIVQCLSPELALLTLALIIAVYDATFSLNMLLTQRKIKLTPAQKKLLGVKSSS